MNPSLDTNGAPLASASSVASQRNGETRPSCIVCRAEIVDNHWFCRLPQNGNGNADPESLTILLCSPRCALRHFATLHPRDNGFDEYEHRERPFHFLINGEMAA